MAFTLQRWLDQKGDATVVPELRELGGAAWTTGNAAQIIETSSRKLRHIIWELVATAAATYNIWIKLYNSTGTIVSGTTEPDLVWPIEFVAGSTDLKMRGGLIWEDDLIRPTFGSGITALASGQAGNLFTTWPANLSLHVDIGVK